MWGLHWNMRSCKLSGLLVSFFWPRDAECEGLVGDLDFDGVLFLCCGKPSSRSTRSSISSWSSRSAEKKDQVWFRSDQKCQMAPCAQIEPKTNVRLTREAELFVTCKRWVDFLPFYGSVISVIWVSEYISQLFYSNNKGAAILPVSLGFILLALSGSGKNTSFSDGFISTEGELVVFFDAAFISSGPCTKVNSK